MITGMPRIAVAAEDFSALVVFFRGSLGMPVIDLSRVSKNKYGAALAMCVPEGGSNIELMSPSDPDTPLSKSLQGFLDRKGEGLFALMLEAPVPNDEADEMAARGLNVMPLMHGAFGRDVHPDSTHGVLIRVYPVNSFSRKSPDTESNSASGLSGIKKVLIAVKNIKQAVQTYGAKFGLPVDVVVENTELGICSAICRPPSGGVIELIAVQDVSKVFASGIQSHIECRGEGMYALVLGSRDLRFTKNFLKREGITVGVAADSDKILEISRAEAFGVLIRIETIKL